MVGIIIDAFSGNYQSMKYFLTALFFTTITSCIPLRIAPNFQEEGYKIKQAKKFKRKLPKENAFIFEDTKDADEFYNFVNTKYQLNHLDVGLEVPFRIDEKLYFLSYYEVEKTTKTLNLLPIFIDGATSGTDLETDLYDNYVSRMGSWYLVITVIDNDSNDCLKESHPSYNKVLEYLKNLKKEYFSTHNYEELLFTKKS